MKRFCTGFAGLLLFPAAAAADGATADGASSGCGGDAYSFGEVVPPNRAGQEGPIIVVPDTLCADLAGRGNSDRFVKHLYRPTPGDDQSAFHHAPAATELRPASP